MKLFLRAVVLRILTLGSFALQMCRRSSSVEVSVGVESLVNIKIADDCSAFLNSYHCCCCLVTM